MFLRKTSIAPSLIAAFLATALASCDNLPGNDTDKWRFYQEIHVSGGTSGQADAAYHGSTGDYQLHENSYYGGSSTGSYQSNYKPYEPYESGSATQYYRGSSEY